ncbi:MAG: transcription antitermination factor NusB [Acidobacteria bacterium]|nr:transcription antitermination factor NusB [Acidobacteriota bacterium]
MGARHRGRERAVQALYEWAVTGRRLDTTFERFWRVRDESDDVRRFAERLVRGVADSAEHIDRLIDHQAVNWRLDRFSNVDRSILRIAIWEMLNEPDTPSAVVIDEAIELGKKFSGPAAGPFINGILDGVRKRLAEEPATAEMEHTNEAGDG